MAHTAQNYKYYRKCSVENRRGIEAIVRTLFERKKFKIIEGKVCPDDVHGLTGNTIPNSNIKFYGKSDTTEYKSPDVF